MSDIENTFDLEKQGVELAKQGQYAEARSIFERVLTTKTVPLIRAQVLRNIMLTYEREGNKVAAIETGKEILAIPGLYDTKQGSYFRSQIKGQIWRLEGRSIWTSPSVSASFAAYSLGALNGAIFGSQVQSSVNQDLRYGGACLGSILGILFLTRLAKFCGSSISLICGILSSGITTYVLLQKGFMPGFAILGTLIITPIFLSRLLSVIYRNK